MSEARQAVKRPEGDKPLTQDRSRLRRRRIAAGLGMRDLSELAGVSYPTISDLEHGHHSARAKTLSKLASALGCKISDLMPDEDQANGSAA